MTSNACETQINLGVPDQNVNVYVGSWHQASTALRAPCGAITQTASSSRSMPEMRLRHSARSRGPCSLLKVATLAQTHATNLHYHAKTCRDVLTQSDIIIMIPPFDKNGLQTWKHF